MSGPPDVRLERLLGGPSLAPLRLRLRRWFERHAEGAEPDMIVLSQIQTTERDALALLAGVRTTSARSMRLDIARLDANLLAAGIARSLRNALEQLDGPLLHRAAVHDALQAAWSTVLDQAGLDIRLHHWLQSPGGASLLKRLARQDVDAARSLVAGADAVTRHLPAGGIARAQLAARTLGNAHALDTGQPLATVVLATWRHAEAVETVADTEPTDDRTRDIWARAGVLVNELARPALVLNLRAYAGLPGEPAYLSLRQLLRTPPDWQVADTRIFVCENPNLVAIAADRLGPACAPVVCTDGMPAAAQRTLLTQLAKAGARLHYHGDFDWPGIQIANHVLRTWAAKPWRMTACDYETAALTAPHTRRDLAERGVEATWDSELAAAMGRLGFGIAEEALADVLMEDLRLG